MGLLSYFFPSEADRIARAQKLLANQRWADARLEVLDLESEAAQQVKSTAESELVRMNLEAAVSWCQADDDGRVMHHLEVAENFRGKDSDALFLDARRQMRTIRAERKAEAERAKEAEDSRMLAADPFGASGGPSWLDKSMPNDLLDAQDDEAAARLALIVEGYPAELRKTVGELGAPFARAILDMEDGRADLALQGLLALPDEQPVIRYERARVAYALGDSAAAARELKQFGTLANGHHPMGRQHSATFLALCLTETGDPEAGLRVLRSARAKNPKLGGALFAQLLDMTGDFTEAESVLRSLIRQHPRDNGLYKLLARVRVNGGHRQGAMAALESALSANDCTPGRCGYQPPDAGVIRGLALLYLEDGVETERGLELAAQAQAMVEKPTWEDAYLVALAAKTGGDPEAKKYIDGLTEHTPPGDARAARINQYLLATA